MVNKSKKTLVLFSFYFTPDLSAGSFRNSTLLEMLEEKSDEDLRVVVITTMPNRYTGYRAESKTYERKGSVEMYRIQIPDHKSGVFDQIKAFSIYFYRGLRISLKYTPTLVYASTSRLFTGFLGALYSRIKPVNLYIDVRDIFLDTIIDIYKKSLLRYLISFPVTIIEKVTIRSATHINLISAGFKNYFGRKYPHKSYTYFSNGVDDIFLKNENNTAMVLESGNSIVYAGNIGEGQGLHILIPGLAKKMPLFSFIIIGDGGAKKKLVEAVQELSNVTLLPPMGRKDILKYYQDSRYTLIHLNDNEAFKKVLPSKVFELAATNKPILAGVAGYAAQFLADNVEHCLLFKPGDHQEAAKLINEHQYQSVNRPEFREKYSRKNINFQMAKSILHYAK
jgi:glycosyltransferase involved in cell wall biosynthesis